MTNITDHRQYQSEPQPTPQEYDAADAIIASFAPQLGAQALETIGRIIAAHRTDPDAQLRETVDELRRMRESFIELLAAQRGNLAAARQALRHVREYRAGHVLQGAPTGLTDEIDAALEGVEGEALIPEPTRDEMLAMVRAMTLYGGGFVMALAECFIMADDDNRTRLYRTFPEYIKQYTDMAKVAP